MNVLHPIADKVLARLRSVRGAVVPAGYFLDLGGRAAIDQALSRLTRQGPSAASGAGYTNCPVSANC